MRLWELEGGDDGEFGHGFAGGRHGGAGDYQFESDEEDDSDEDDSESDDTEDGEVEDDDDDIPGEPIDLRNLQPELAVPPPLDHQRPIGGDGRPAHPRGRGADRRYRERDRVALGRFLEMVRDDVAEEWDSDEMSGDEVDEIEDLAI